jgi:MoaA/NifB/PqqE/SkfB family radical SAM enzyme|tara:strand:- start:23 stop:1138 length:1116 start_codon:yes stop_codon:yes gene_type:complete
VTSIDLINCNALKGSVTISQKGLTLPCCQFIVPIDDNNTSGVNDFYSIYKNNSLNDAFDNWSNTSINCATCIYEEANDIKSLRDFWNWKIPTPANKIEYLEVSLDFTCNMMCRSCGPSQSSKWNGSDILIEMADLYNDTWGAYQKNPGSRDYTKALIHNIKNTDLTGLKQVILVGGEPLYSKSLPWFINYIKENTDCRKIKLVTNGSLIPNPDLFEGFDLEIQVSIDAIGDLASAIRMKVPFETIDKNIRAMKKLYDVSVHSTISILNINKMQELLDYCVDVGVVQNTMLLHDPEWLTVKLIPNKFRDRWHLEHKKIYPEIRIKKYLGVDYHHSPKLVKAFLKSIELTDRESEIKFRDVNPEIMEIMETLL